MVGDEASQDGTSQRLLGNLLVEEQPEPQLQQQQQQLENLLSVTEKKDSVWEAQLCSHLFQLFSSPQHLSSAFRQIPNLDHRDAEAKGAAETTNAAGINFGAVRTLYNKIRTMDISAVSGAIISASTKLMEKHLPESAVGSPPKALLCSWLIIFANPMLLEPENQNLLQSVAKVLTCLDHHERALVVNTLATFSAEDLEEMVATVQQCITLQLYEASRVTEAVQLCTKLLKIIYDANLKSRVLPVSAFYNDAVNNKDLVDPNRQYAYWKEPQRYAFSFCSFPFILDLSTKCHILQVDSRQEMQIQFQRAFFDGLFNSGGFIEPFFVLRVRRDNLIHDAITHVQRNRDDLKKPLRVQFVGEDAVDEGGVRKEFFQLVVQELFDPKYGMFSYSEDSRLFWFSLQPGELEQVQSEMEEEQQQQQQRMKQQKKQEEEEKERESRFEDLLPALAAGASSNGTAESTRTGNKGTGKAQALAAAAAEGSQSSLMAVIRSSSRRGIAVEDLELRREYELVGMLLGLAIYNSCILDIHLPGVVYRKLLGRSPSLEDLGTVDKELAKGLKDLLEFEGDVEDVYSRTFQVTVDDVYSCSHEIELKPGGAAVPLTNSNRQEYVDLCVKFYLETSIERQFNAFAEGFKYLVPERILKLFDPEELELLICGTSDLDLNDLEKGAQYADGYVKGHKTIVEFWEVANSLSEAEKKNLLMFVTGCDRAPVRGLSSLKFTISRNGPDSDRLPSAHTCFNHLLLPEYSSKEKLKARLLTAINNAKGFGLH